MAEAAGPIEDVAHDDLCPVCQLLLFIPVRTQCNHLLCASCMAQWADASSSNSSISAIEHSSADVTLADFDPNYDPTYDLEANCPMCRTHTTAAPDTALATQLASRYPKTYAERHVEEQVERGSRVGQDGVEGFMILIGNKHKLVRESEDDNEHDWTFFVRTSRPELVKEVRIYLHPTFRPPQLTIRRPPYEVRRLGWGTFTLDAEIVLKEPYGWVVDGRGTRQASRELTWTLDFSGAGMQGRVRGKIKKYEETPTVVGGRVLRSRRPPMNIAVENDQDEEDDEDDDFDEDDIEDAESSTEDEEGASEFIEHAPR